ncbi:MAG: SDR family oxidoreductase [Acidobacteriota bacterium]|nr:SDR family oxidoreductase [Acidobacteriota bacterium]
MRPVALITGASSGIGEVFARKLAATGHDLILVARRADRLQALARELACDCRIVAADLTSEEGLSEVEQVIGDCTGLALLVNNAGFGTLGRFWEAELEGQYAMHRLHVRATLRLTHAALRNMVPRGAGAVINVSSVAAFTQGVGNVSYCATKAWMNSFTEGIAVELRSVRSPVRVQALCPGFTVTEFHETLGFDRASIPSFLWLRAEQVVDASLKGLARGKVIVIPGWKYKAAVAVLRNLPWAIRKRSRRPGRDTSV